jgi:cellulose synthase/poly-beta-1,6-N-acetylglucosamine synthase-like glycosyltransferase
MVILICIIIYVLIAQLLFTIQVVCNHHFAMKKHQRQRTNYRPQCVLIVPCKGLDEAFDENIESFFKQDYQGYDLYFVVEDRSDPAYDRLLQLKAKHKQVSMAHSVRIFVAGIGQSCSQKLHNLLCAYEQIPDNAEVMVFADSDACAGEYWLSHLVYPLRQEKNGASSGYRCFIPQTNNLASIALSSLNAKICQLLGNTRFTLAWGGSMAILVKNFRDFGVDKVWQKALSDDLALSRAVRKHRKKVVFVPACMIASFQTSTWSEVWEFSRRQFLITRIYSPKMWWFGLYSAILSVLSIWGSLGVAIWASVTQPPFWPVFLMPPILFLGYQIYRTVLRQSMIMTLLSEHREKMKYAHYADLYFFWAWSILFLLIMLTSAVGRTITWRNIRYKIKSPTNIEITKETKCSS